MLDETASIYLLKNALVPFGFSFESFRLDDKPYTRLIAPSGNTWTMYDCNLNYPSMPAAAARISRNKTVAHEFAEQLDVHSPWTRQVDTNINIEERAALLAHAPLVVKPADASLSNGVSLSITTDEQLVSAITLARTFSEQILVQEEANGEEVRIVVVEGQARAAILRQTPRVIGDGQSSLRQLIEAENQARKAITSPYLSYPMLSEELIDLSAFDLDSVPAKHEIIQLGRGTMIKRGASMYDVFDQIDTSYLAMAETMARSLGAGFMAVDMIIEDYLRPATAKNYVFLEFNTSPVLKLFYGCRDGQHFDVLPHLAHMINVALGGNTNGRTVLGSLESVSFPEVGIDTVVAKVDTGAYSGAIHCSDIRVEQNDAGKKVLVYTPCDMPSLTTEKYIKTFVRSANGHESTRYLIDTTIVVQGKSYPIRIGLSDRSDMRRQVLIGRRFLRAHNMLVDVTSTKYHDDKGETKL